MAKTVQEQIAALELDIKQKTAKLDVLRQRVEMAARVADIVVGDRVVVTVGRGNTREVVEAEVLAVQTDPLRCKVLYGTGFDQAVAVVMATAVSEVITADVVEEEQ